MAALCKAIQANPDLVYEYTNKVHSITIVSDGTRVLGLADIGPEAGLPVMEGKALLFKQLGGVDAVPLCARAKDLEDFIRVVKTLELSIDGINLEDIVRPKCFLILDRLRREMDISVWHDDQQGPATVLLSGLINSQNVVGKPLPDTRVAIIGAGAASVAMPRLLEVSGLNSQRIITCDSKGTLHRHRQDIAELLTAILFRPRSDRRLRMYFRKVALRAAQGISKLVLTAIAGLEGAVFAKCGLP